ncbi:hypothetical protein NDN08_000347 [Rhodosorus marinus]|uniref:Uncharacterized protein n=1 Tax=Rhodosorus marinus TaxID=101924 RepID=A0AAV8UMN0_9RHOD|nr:hypothetical protein NDN08_000347 [Rhodosorus marinus]
MAFVVGGLSFSGAGIQARCVRASGVGVSRRAPRVSMSSEPNTAENTDTDADKAAEEARRILNDGDSMVDLGGSYQAPREGQRYAATSSGGYQPGSKGLDVWLITGLLVFLVPIVITIVGVINGWIDLDPR